jgi:Zn-dependent protease/predicted transcriptional regulator
MESHIKLGRIFGIPIGLHYSWGLIALLITLSLAAHFQALHPEWGAPTAWVTAVVTGLLFFAAIIVHELAHAVVAKMRGLPVRSITLFALGGVAQIEKESADASGEFWMGIAGPITSAAVGLLCLGLALVFGWTMATEPGTPPLSMLVWLGYINVGLALFNMIPGFPMDGGRVLRAIVWKVTGDGDKATRIAALTGQGIAFTFIVIGLISFFRGAGFNGLWTAFIGWFLLTASRSAYLQVETAERLRGIRVAEVMTRDFPVVEGRSSLQTFVDDYLLATGRRCFVAIDDDRAMGLITLHEVKKVDRARWSSTTVSDVMVPLARLSTVKPDTPVTEALELLGRADVNQVAVMSDGRLEGILSRDRVLQLLVTRAELDM